MYLRDSSSKRVIKKSHELNQERKRTDIITDATHKKMKIKIKTTHIKMAKNKFITANAADPTARLARSSRHCWWV